MLDRKLKWRHDESGSYAFHDNAVFSKWSAGELSTAEAVRRIEQNNKWKTGSLTAESFVYAALGFGYELPAEWTTGRKEDDN